MKALVQNDYGTPEALEIKEVDKPKMKDDEVLVEVYAASINAGDNFTLKGKPWLTKLIAGLPKPKDYILGWDIAGCVKEIGKNVIDFKPGDEVFTSCKSAFAEYISVSQSKLAFKPSNISFEQAAAVPTAGITALYGLRETGKIKKGQKVLINGASGGVGTFAVQIAKSFEAEVTGVCSTRNLEMVKSIGADYVIDYKKEDFTKLGKKYDCILDNVASHLFSDLRKVLNENGIIVPNSGHGGMGYVAKAFLASMIKKQHAKMFVAPITSEKLTYLKQLIENEKVMPVIEKVYPFKNAKDAFYHLENNHVYGKLVLKIRD